MRGSISVVGAAILAAAVQSAAAHAAPVPQTLIQQRLLAQQGLSVALATMVLKTQMSSFVGIGFMVGCQSIGGGGAFKTLSQSITANSIGGRIQLFFDEGCTKLYADETLNLVVKSTTPFTAYTLTATVQLYAKNGKKVGTLSIPNTILSVPTPTSIKLSGLQTFKPVAASAKPLKMALNCELPRNADPESESPGDADEASTRQDDIKCVGAVAQDFAAIKKSAASITPLTLHFPPTGGVTFKQTSPGKLMTGKLGKLSPKVAANGTVSITGGATNFGSTKLTGNASQLDLFPAKPTAWAVTDQAHGKKFSIQLLSDTAGNFGGAVETTNGSDVAPFTLDQGGTGTIKYSNGVKAPISSWVLSK